MEKAMPGSVNIYEIMAALFATIAEEVEGRFGAEGEDAMRAAVKKFGNTRGRFIARSVAEAGKENTAENYLPYYDMERSAHFAADTTGNDKEIRQNFSKCIFAEAWMKTGMEKYGLYYCEEIDPAIAEGYNKNFKCEHDKYFLKGDQCCTFRFYMDEQKKA